ncbi:MAG: arylsulfatase [Bacteroidota bacterium]
MSRLLLFSLLIGLIGCQSSPPETPPPNVLLILTDDQGYGDLSLHGNDSIDTPVLDQFANQAVRLNQFHVSPVCAPTRASLLTGRYHLRTGTFWVTRGTENMRPEETTMAEVFGENGYATGLFGKWHNGAHYPHDPNGQGFDEFIGFCSGHWTNYFDTPLQAQDSMIQTEGFITDVLTDRAIDFIERKKEQPFFCYVPLNAPHGPFQVPDRYFDKYKSRGLTDRNAAIYGMIENVDENVGRLLESLDRLQITNNTIVIFITDNGPNGDRFNGGMKGRKAQVHLGGHRVPCFVHFPDVIGGGKIIEETAAHIDILPTLMTLCGLETSKPLQFDGQDLSALLTGMDDSLANRRIFTHMNHGDHLMEYPAAVRDDAYHFVANQAEEPELYDLRTDYGQQHNLADSLPELTAQYHQAYRDWFADVSQGIESFRSIPIGYAAAPRVSLPAHEARISGPSIRYKHDKNGWAHDWVIDWKDEQDQMKWQIEAVQAGEFEVLILYANEGSRPGTRLTLSTADQQISQIIDSIYIPTKIPSPDRVPDRIEAFDQSWASLQLGTIMLPQGQHELVLRAENIPDDRLGEIKGMVLVKK